MDQFKVGDNVEYLGCSKEQKQWGNNDWPPCILGHVYVITDVEVHSYHTKVQLKGIQGKFNSVCFKLVD